jgi:hypothetical protein
VIQSSRQCAYISDMSLTPEQRSAQAHQAAHASWARTADRTARVAPANAGLEQRHGGSQILAITANVVSLAVIGFGVWKTLAMVADLHGRGLVS